MSKAERNEYQKNWLNNPNHPERKDAHRKRTRKNQRTYYQRHKLEHYLYQKDYIIKHKGERRKKLLELIGNKCFVCGEIKHIMFHEIHNKRHPISMKYYFYHLKDFIPLCYRCHRTLHTIILNFVEWTNKISELTQGLNTSK